MTRQDKTRKKRRRQDKIRWQNKTRQGKNKTRQDKIRWQDKTRQGKKKKTG